MRLFKKREKKHGLIKRLEIGDPETRYCTECGREMRSRRYSEYNSKTGDESVAKWQYQCPFCQLWPV